MSILTQQEIETVHEMDVLLAKAFGLNTHNLISFQLTVGVHELPKINAVYRVDNFDKITAIGKQFRLTFSSINEDVGLLDAGNGLKEDTTIEDTVCHFCKS